MSRKKIPVKTSDEVIFLSDLKCCICQGDKRGHHIHHIDKNPSNNKIDNLCFLCFNCHDEASVESGNLKRKLTPSLIKKFRDDFYKRIKEKRESHKKINSEKIKEGIFEEILLETALNANKIIELFKIKHRFYETNKQERYKLIYELGIYSEYTNYRFAYEVLSFLLQVSSGVRYKESENLVISIYDLVCTYHFNVENDEEQEIMDNLVMYIANNIIYDATIYLRDLKILAYGCNVLKYLHKTTKDATLKEKIRKNYSRLLNDFERREDERNKDVLRVINIFIKDLSVDVLAFPPMPKDLAKFVFNE